MRSRPRTARPGRPAQADRAGGPAPRLCRRGPALGSVDTALPSPPRPFPDGVRRVPGSEHARAHVYKLNGQWYGFLLPSSPEDASTDPRDTWSENHGCETPVGRVPRGGANCNLGTCLGLESSPRRCGAQGCAPTKRATAAGPVRCSEGRQPETGWESRFCATRAVSGTRSSLTLPCAVLRSHCPAGGPEIPRTVPQGGAEAFTYHCSTSDIITSSHVAVTCTPSVYNWEQVTLKKNPSFPFKSSILLS